MNSRRSFKISNSSLNQLENDQALRSVNHSSVGRTTQYPRLGENDDIYKGSVDGQSHTANESGKHLVF